MSVDSDSPVESAAIEISTDARKSLARLVLDELLQEVPPDDALSWPGTFAPSLWTLRTAPAREKLVEAPEDRVLGALLAPSTGSQEDDAALAEVAKQLFGDRFKSAHEYKTFVAEADAPSEAFALQQRARQKESVSFTKGSMGSAEVRIYTPGGTEGEDPVSALASGTSAPGSRAQDVALRGPEAVAASLVPLASAVDARTGEEQTPFQPSPAVREALRTCPSGDPTFDGGGAPCVAGESSRPRAGLLRWMTPPESFVELLQEAVAAHEPTIDAERTSRTGDGQPGTAPDATQEVSVDAQPLAAPAPPVEEEDEAPEGEHGAAALAKERRWEIVIDGSFQDEHEEDGAVFAQGMRKARELAPDRVARMAEGTEEPAQAVAAGSDIGAVADTEAPTGDLHRVRRAELADEDALVVLADQLDLEADNDVVDAALVEKMVRPTGIVDSAAVPTEPTASQAVGVRESWAETALLDVSDFSSLVPRPAQEYPFELDTFQKQAVARLERREHVFVAAHTSAGKTVVAEYAMALCLKRGTRCVYTSPIKALSNQKYRDFREKYGAENVGIVTGDVSVNVDAGCLVMTTEILRSMLYRGADLVRDLEWCIFDEVHYVNDSERGVVWEEVIIMLPSQVGMVFLSATTPNTTDFCDWVGRTKRKPVHVVYTDHRPVPLHHFLVAKGDRFPILSPLGAFEASAVDLATRKLNNKEIKRQQAAKAGPKQERERGIQRAGAGRGASASGRGGRGGQKRSSGGSYGVHNAKMAGRAGGSRGDWQKLIRSLHADGLTPAVIFSFSKRRCDEAADYLTSTDLNSGAERAKAHRICMSALRRLSPFDAKLPQVQRIVGLVLRGIGVHHGGLLPILKETVEILFTAGLVKVLFATETFAMGVNAPAKTVVFNGTRKHDGKSFRDITPAEYTQMAGRAGRRGLDSVGTVLVVCWEAAPSAQTLRIMMTGKPTRLASQFRLRYAMILSLLRTEDLSVEDMIRRSFSEAAAQRALGQRDLPALISDGEDAADALAAAASGKPCIRVEGHYGGSDGGNDPGLEDGRGIGSWTIQGASIGNQTARLLNYAMAVGGMRSVATLLPPGRLALVSLPSGGELLDGSRTGAVALAPAVVMARGLPPRTEGDPSEALVLVLISKESVPASSSRGFPRSVQLTSVPSGGLASAERGLGKLVAKDRFDDDDEMVSSKKKRKGKKGRGAGGGNAASQGVPDATPASSFVDDDVPDTEHVNSSAVGTVWEHEQHCGVILRVPLGAVRILGKECFRGFDAPSLVLADRSRAACAGDAGAPRRRPSKRSVRQCPRCYILRRPCSQATGYSLAAGSSTFRRRPS